LIFAKILEYSWISRLVLEISWKKFSFPLFFLENGFSRKKHFLVLDLSEKERKERIFPEYYQNSKDPWIGAMIFNRLESFTIFKIDFCFILNY